MDRRRVGLLVVALALGAPATTRAQEMGVPAGPAPFPLGEAVRGLVPGTATFGVHLRHASVGLLTVRTSRSETGLAFEFSGEWAVPAGRRTLQETVETDANGALRRFVSREGDAFGAITTEVAIGPDGRATASRTRTPKVGPSRSEPLEMVVPAGAVPANLLLVLAPRVPWANDAAYRLTALAAGKPGGPPVALAMTVRGTGASGAIGRAGAVAGTLIRCQAASGVEIPLPELLVSAAGVESLWPDPGLPGLRLVRAADEAEARRDLPRAMPAEDEAAVLAVARRYLRGLLLGDPVEVEATVDLAALKNAFQTYVPDVGALDDADFARRVREQVGKLAGRAQPAGLDGRLDIALALAALESEGDDASFVLPRPAEGVLDLHRGASGWKVTFHTALTGR